MRESNFLLSLIDKPNCKIFSINYAANILKQYYHCLGPTQRLYRTRLERYDRTSSTHIKRRYVPLSRVWRKYWDRIFYFWWIVLFPNLKVFRRIVIFASLRSSIWAILRGEKSLQHSLQLENNMSWPLGVLVWRYECLKLPNLLHL